VLTEGVRAAAEGVEAGGSRLGRREEDTELEERCWRVRWGTGCVEGVVSSVALLAEGSWYAAFVELEDMDVVLATDEECALNTDSSRVNLFTCTLNQRTVHPMGEKGKNSQ
jgi:hypothetical protein